MYEVVLCPSKSKFEWRPWAGNWVNTIGMTFSAFSIVCFNCGHEACSWGANLADGNAVLLLIMRNLSRDTLIFAVVMSFHFCMISYDISCSVSAYNVN